MRGPSQRGARFGAIGQIGLKPPLSLGQARVTAKIAASFKTLNAVLIPTIARPITVIAHRNENGFRYHKQLGYPNLLLPPLDSPIKFIEAVDFYPRIRNY